MCDDAYAFHQQKALMRLRLRKQDSARSQTILSSVVQMGAPPGHGNENKTGWAWIDTQPGQHLQILEAYRLADLVGNTLRLQVRLHRSC